MFKERPIQILICLMFFALPLCAQRVAPHPAGGRSVAVDEVHVSPVGRLEDARAVGAPPIPLRIRIEQSEKQRALEVQYALHKGIAPAASGTYRFADLNLLSYADLVTTLVSIRYFQITDLFQFNRDTKAFFLDPNRVQYLIDALQSRASTFTPADDQGIETLVEVVRSGFYLGFYYSDLASLNTRSYKDKCLPAIRAAQANPNFALGTYVQDLVVEEFGLLVDDADSDPGVINGFTPILNSFNDNWLTYGTEYSKQVAVYNVLGGVDYDLTWGVLQGYPYDPTLAGPFHHAIDGYLDEVTRLATTFNYDNPNSSWMIDNAVYFAGYDDRFHSTPNFGVIAMTTVIQKYGRSPWVYSSAQAAEIIHFLYGDTDANGQVLSWPQIQNDIRTYYTPVKNDFDCGLFHTQVGDKVDATKISSCARWAAMCPWIPATTRTTR